MKFIIRFFNAIAIVLALLILIFYFYIVLPIWGIPFNGQRHGRVPMTPAWALECWLWEDDDNTAEAIDTLLAGYARHDIPVRTIIIDSPWSTRYNDFSVDERRYPEPEQWFRKLQEQGYRVVLWMTCMVNSKNKNTAIRNSLDWYDTARTNGFLVGNGYQFNWWLGRGGFIDYTNPAALQWWRELQQQVFDYGIDGWKLDGTATFFSSNLWRIPIPYQRTHKGWMTTRGYMDLYYRQEYDYGNTQNPEFITLARSIDRPYTHPEGFAPFDAAPVTWVGDQRHAWKSGSPDSAGIISNADLMMGGDEGIEEALRDVLLSAKRGYCVIGSDVAGFSGSIIPPRLYIRWAQFSCFCGLFMNGGHGDRALWRRSQQELDIIRKFSWLHTELIPYMYTQVVNCHQGGKPLMRPVKGRYHYLFGDDLLVAPIYMDSLTNTITLPKGKWFYFFDNESVIDGPTTFKRDFPLAEYPVYVRAGAIIPMNISRPYTGLGDDNSGGHLTWLIYPHGDNQFTVQQPDRSGSTTVNVIKTSNRLEIHFSGVQKSSILRIVIFDNPIVVKFDTTIIPEGETWQYDSGEKVLLVKMAASVQDIYVDFEKNAP